MYLYSLYDIYKYIYYIYIKKRNNLQFWLFGLPNWKSASLMIKKSIHLTFALCTVVFKFQSVPAFRDLSVDAYSLCSSRP